MEAIEAILTRRSTRNMRPDMPPRELIEQVIEAGRHAPSGGNNQTTHLLVITDKTVLAQLAETAEREFAKMEITPDMYRSMQNSVNQSKKGGYVFHRNAPVLIVLANKRGYTNAMADSVCVLENMLIAANALDLGSCYINQLHWLDESAAIRDILEPLGLGTDETITASMVIGYAADGLPARKPLARSGNPVTWI